MASELESWFKGLSKTLQREFAGDFRAIVDGFKDELVAAAPQGPTGNTKRSVRVTRGRGSLELIVRAGGTLTTKEVRGGSGAPYDYSLAEEFGNSHMAAQPWFYPTYRARRDDLQREISDAVANVIAKA